LSKSSSNKFAFFLLLFLATRLSAGEKSPPLIRIPDVAPGIVVDMRYATPDNFTGQTLYPEAECLLCEPAAHRLARVQAKLAKKGLGLKVWDCYRPVSVQKKLWDRVPDDRYVANPQKGSRHNRGASVDLTLVDKKGRELSMPTKFDEFSEKAHRDFMDLPSDVLKNRQTLEDAMVSEGFVPLPTEWWHFDEPDWRNFALRDEPLGSKSLLKDQPAAKVEPVIPSETRQLILVIAPNWDSKKGVMRRYERRPAWTKIDEAPVILGAKGLAWGCGLTSLEGKGPVKKEGDHRTPTGIFPVGKAYGPGAEPPEGTSWPYQPVNEKWFCVDDPKSGSYNLIVNVEHTEKDWSSAEEMRRKDFIYDWVINIEQNYPGVKAGCGSCIFFHVWRKPDGITEGCVAMAEDDIKKMMVWLKPKDKPLTVILTEDSYHALKKAWDLP
jgi:D-alanyl-D-alanine dipeptidase